MPQPLQSDGEEDSEEWTDEEEDGEEGEEEGEEGESTLREEESIGRSWRERIAGREAGEDKENQGELLEFSPPEKMPKNSPSYLIWSIFTKVGSSALPSSTSSLLTCTSSPRSGRSGAGVRCRPPASPPRAGRPARRVACRRRRNSRWRRARRPRAPGG